MFLNRPLHFRFVSFYVSDAACTVRVLANWGLFCRLVFRKSENTLKANLKVFSVLLKVFSVLWLSVSCEFGLVGEVSRKRLKIRSNKVRLIWNAPVSLLGQCPGFEYQTVHFGVTGAS